VTLWTSKDQDAIRDTSLDSWAAIPNDEAFGVCIKLD
jgi:hypothetical protein